MFALYSGIRAAEAIVSCLARPGCGDRLLAEYSAKVHAVLASNQHARRLLYSSERRFANAEYWQQQRESFAP